MLRLFHVSDNFGITTFVPRPVNATAWGDLSDSVWSVDQHKLQNYLLPRDCPRVCWSVNPELNIEDKALMQEYGNPRTVIFVQNDYLDEVVNTELMIYEFDNEAFYLIDESAGYYVSHREEKPLGARIVNDLVNELALMHTKLVFVENLREYAEQSVKRTFTYSNIRMGMLK